MVGIDVWWPKLDEQIRRWIVNNLWAPLAPYTLGEIARVGGPDDTDTCWASDDDGGLILPREAILWLMEHPDFERLKLPQKPDPRAAYFRRGGPKRQRN